MTANHDAVVVGAGPAGSTAAILLARAGWSVALIEKQAFPRRKVCGACIGAGNIPLMTTLGVGDDFARLAGPELREVALYCGERTAQAPLPRVRGTDHPWGRALGREAFDVLLLERAKALGVSVFQPASLTGVDGHAGAFRCELESPAAGGSGELRAPVLIMANGSWGRDAAEDRHAFKKPGDLFAFKANFSGAKLHGGTLPVLSFAGGYGGLVIADGGLLTLAGCIRRDVLAACRGSARGQTAGEAFEYYLRRSTSALREALAGARREGPWLGVGPIQPGIRRFWSRFDGRFYVGNAAAEAHPLIGEGISMAMQAAGLLCAGLVAAGRGRLSADTLRHVGSDYERQWRKAFAPRLRWAAALAHLAMRPGLAPMAWPAFSRSPGLMTAIARRAGKARAAPSRAGSPLAFETLENLK
jgi:flavin-dependent dehydrogenase